MHLNTNSSKAAFSFPKILIFLCFLLLTNSSVFAQNEDSTQVQGVEEKISTLQNLISSINALKEDIHEKTLELEKTATEEEESAIKEEITQFDVRLEELKKDLILISTGIDPSLFFSNNEEALSWNDELRDIFSPIIHELKDATARPREIDQLRNSLLLDQTRGERVSEALKRLETLKASNIDTSIDAHLKEQIDFWQQQQIELENKISANALQLQERESSQKSLSESFSDLMRVFFKSRGKNLVFALIAFILTFFSFRFLHRLFKKALPENRFNGRQFFIRIGDLVFYLFTIITSISLFLAVLYRASDWLLLGISIVLLFGLVWIGKNTIPKYFEQGKLLLDLGPVREGEVVIYNHVPWLVESLNIYTDLYNEELEGGRLRLPIKDITKFRSRKRAETEQWFPSSLEDWVMLSDGYYGKVVQQSPTTVVIATQRGSLKSYSIQDYLKNKPQNLSRNFFARNQKVPIPIQYATEIPTRIAPALKKHFEEEISKQFYGEHLVEVRVELNSFEQYYAKLQIILKFKGGAASEYFEIGWLMQQIAVDGLYKLGIEVPIPAIALQGNNGEVVKQPDF